MSKKECKKNCKKECKGEKKLDIIYKLAEEARRACADNIDQTYIEGVIQSILIIIGED